MGLRPLWIRIADNIGFEAFVDMWRTFHEHEDMLDERNRVTIPIYSTYLRFQRNQVIRSLGLQGKSSNEICETLRDDHGVTLSLKAINRILAKLQE